jgi:hypothetical protein
MKCSFIHVVSVATAVTLLCLVAVLPIAMKALLVVRPYDGALSDSMENRTAGEEGWTLNPDLPAR